MSDPIVLCVDSEVMRHPELVGLDGENLFAQPWLRVFASAVAARSYLRDGGSAAEVWVVSSDDIDPINAAAGIKADARQRTVRLVAFEGTGSLKSRASQAGVDVVSDRRGFAQRYADEKRLWDGIDAGEPADSPCEEAAGGEACPEPSDAEKRGKRFVGASYGQDSGSPGVVRESVRDAAHVREPTFDESALEPPAQASSAGSPSCLAGRPASVAVDAGAFVLPVVSGSGGAGKSTVAALAALLSQKLGFRTLLVDLDLQFGDMSALLGQPDPLRVDEAVAVPERALQLAPKGSMPALLAAPLRLERGEAVAAHVPELIDALRGSFDVIVANTGSLWAEQHAAVLERSSKALFLVDQRPSSLRACRHAVELCSRCGIATSPFVFAVNRCSKGALYTSIDVSCALHGASAVELRDGGSEVEELFSAGLPLDLVGSRNDLCSSLERVLIDILPGCSERVEASPKREERSLFAWAGRRRLGRRAACLC